jgi:hypothetical protein
MMEGFLFGIGLILALILALVAWANLPALLTVPLAGLLTVLAGLLLSLSPRVRSGRPSRN